jgi:hypothetical protein
MQVAELSQRYRIFNDALRPYVSGVAGAAARPHFAWQSAHFCAAALVQVLADRWWHGHIAIVAHACVAMVLVKEFYWDMNFEPGATLLGEVIDTVAYFAGIASGAGIVRWL